MNLKQNRFETVLKHSFTAIDRIPDFFARQSLCFSSISFIDVVAIRHVRQTKFARSLVNFFTHIKILTD